MKKSVRKRILVNIAVSIVLGATAIMMACDNAANTNEEKSNTPPLQPLQMKTSSITMERNHSFHSQQIRAETKPCLSLAKMQSRNNWQRQLLP